MKAYYYSVHQFSMLCQIWKFYIISSSKYFELRFFLKLTSCKNRVSKHGACMCATEHIHTHTCALFMQKHSHSHVNTNHEYMLTFVYACTLMHTHLLACTHSCSNTHMPAYTYTHILASHKIAHTIICTRRPRQYLKYLKCLCDCVLNYSIEVHFNRT